MDDGTGTARCIIWAASDAPSTDFALGHYVQVRAMLEWYNKVPVLVVTWLRSDKDPHAELVWFVEVHQVHNRVYSAGYSPKVIQASQSVASQQFSSK